MTLFSFFDGEEETKPLQSLEEKIKQRRFQILVHSYLYYELESPLIDDDTWQKYANELVDLQKQKSKIGFHDSQFKDWDSSTGFDFKYDDQIIGIANRLLKINYIS